MVSIQKKRQSKKLFSQLDECDADFMIGQINHEAQAENKTNMADNVSLRTI